jgi:hypothetical protein
MYDLRMANELLRRMCVAFLKLSRAQHEFVRTLHVLRDLRASHIVLGLPWLDDEQAWLKFSNERLLSWWNIFLFQLKLWIADLSIYLPDPPLRLLVSTLHYVRLSSQAYLAFSLEASRSPRMLVSWRVGSSLGHTWSNASWRLVILTIKRISTIMGLELITIGVPLWVHFSSETTECNKSRYVRVLHSFTLLRTILATPVVSATWMTMMEKSWRQGMNKGKTTDCGKCMGSKFNNNTRRWNGPVGIPVPYCSNAFPTYEAGE